jgi:hypothetical protein
VPLPLGNENHLLVIAEENVLTALAHEIEAGDCISARERVAEAPDLVAAFSLGVGEDGLERKQVAVHIRDDADSPHWLFPRAAAAAAVPVSALL